MPIYSGSFHQITFLVRPLRFFHYTSKSFKFGIVGQYDEHIAALRRRPEKLKLTPIVTRFAIFTISLMGGVSLIVPMVVLIYTRSMSIKIVALSISVLAFAAMLAVFTRAKNQELLVATAAYAAVLVVFLGSSSSPQPSS
jgi:hypothetical protein